MSTVGSPNARANAATQLRELVRQEAIALAQTISPHPPELNASYTEQLKYAQIAVDRKIEEIANMR